MRHARTARPYARALWELAHEQGRADQVGRELERLAALIAAEAAIREFFARPWVSAGAKRGVALEVAGRLGASPLVRDFAGLVARQGRAAELPAILESYRALADEAAGRVRARVRTAVALTEAERAALSERLGRALGGKAVVLEEGVDSQLLGGFIVEVDSYIVDGSLDGQLARLSERLARG